MKNKNLVIVILGIILVLVAAVEERRLFTAGTRSAETPAASGAGRKVLYWTDPMKPAYRSDKPGKSPFMDMDLVPVYEADSSGAPVVAVRPEIVNNLGVRTYRVTRADSVRRLSIQGYLFREGGRLYMLADFLDREATSVQPGLAATVRVADFPGREWDAVVDRIQPDLDIGGRTLKARLRIKTPGAELKPNMFAEAVIRLPVTGAHLAIPREALIRTGTRAAVILALGEGRFRPVAVVPGEESGDRIEIRQGLSEGDTVVVSGQFLIDSEASVRASFERMGTMPAGASDIHLEKKP